MSRTTLLHYGLQRSGTNFFEALLKQRYRLRLVNDTRERRSPAHKHARLYPAKDLIPEPQYLNDLAVDGLASFEALLPVVPDHYVVISKDPHSWFLSYVRFGQRCGWPAPAHHYVEEYNAFYGSFLDLAEETDRISFVRYIDLLTGTDRVLADLEQRMALQRRHVLRPRAIRRVRVSETFTDASLAYYREQQYLDEFDAPALEALDSHLDHEVARRLGYPDPAS